MMDAKVRTRNTALLTKVLIFHAIIIAVAVVLLIEYKETKFPADQKTLKDYWLAVTIVIIAAAAILAFVIAYMVDHSHKKLHMGGDEGYMGSVRYHTFSIYLAVLSAAVVFGLSIYPLVVLFQDEKNADDKFAEPFRMVTRTWWTFMVLVAGVYLLYTLFHLWLRFRGPATAC